MSNDKLSLNFKLKKSDLESKILAKLLKKGSDKFPSIKSEDQSSGGTLTELERTKRAKALLNLSAERIEQKGDYKNDRKRMVAGSDVNEKGVAGAPKKVLDNEQVTVNKKEKSTDNGERKNEHKAHVNRPVERKTKKEFASKKKSMGAPKKYSKHGKFIISKDIESDGVTVKKHSFHMNKIERKKTVRKIKISFAMTVHEIATKTFEAKNRVIGVVEKLDSEIDINKPIDPDIVELVIQELGHIPKRVTNNIMDGLLEDEEEDPSMLKSRPPIVTIMGHVDHGKTTLIDSLRDSNIIDTEYGGITQHIGAYQIKTTDNQLITVIDTPGHAAFTAMRARGAQVTDIVILVVAADDSIKDQTIEAINHIKAAGVTVIVAVNKIDKPEANVSKVTNDLLQYNIIPEECGGDVLVVPISARDKVNLDKLEEAILLQASVLELQANPNKKAKGVILEAELNKKSGVLATVIIRDGTLKRGDIIVAGKSYCKIKAMVDCNGSPLKEALPSTPVELMGFESVPDNGECFVTVKNEKDAKFIVDIRNRNSQQLSSSMDDISDLFRDEKQQISFIIKSDTQGSIEAILDYINKFSIEEIEIKVLHKAVGVITESDILLAEASSAKIIAFCVREEKKLSEFAEKHGVSIYHYSIIYDLIDNIKEMLSGLLPTLKNEKSLGRVLVREVFTLSRSGKIAGCYVQDGLIKRDARIRLLRDSRLIYEGKVATLRRFKNDEKEVSSGYECGISLENYSDIKANDIMESFEIIETKQTL